MHVLIQEIVIHVTTHNINLYVLMTVQELIHRSIYTLRTSSNVLILRINLIYQFCTHLIFHQN